MSEIIKILKCISIMFLIVLITECAPAKKNTYYAKRKKNSQVSATQLGRNKYYFSSAYQNKLNKKYKKR